MKIKAITLLLTTTSWGFCSLQSQAQQIIIQQGSASASATGNNALSVSSVSQQARQQTENLGSFFPLLSIQQGIANSTAIGNETRAFNQIQQQSRQNLVKSEGFNGDTQLSIQQAVTNSTAINQ